MDERLLTARDVARQLHVSLSYVYALIRRGDIRSVHIGSAVRVHPQDLERYIREHYSTSYLSLKRPS